MTSAPLGAPPLIAVTPWRRTVDTWIHPEHDLCTIDPEYLDAVTEAGGIPALVRGSRSRRRRTTRPGPGGDGGSTGCY
ncbi:MAG: hypothetical protein R2710_29145 [Acidimicrobiales bacterium]